LPRKHKENWTQIKADYLSPMSKVQCPKIILVPRIWYLRPDFLTRRYIVVEVGAKLRLLRVGPVRCRTRNDITLNDVYIRDWKSLLLNRVRLLN